MIPSQKNAIVTVIYDTWDLSLSYASDEPTGHWFQKPHSLTSFEPQYPQTSNKAKPPAVSHLCSADMESQSKLIISPQLSDLLKEQTNNAEHLGRMDS